MKNYCKAPTFLFALLAAACSLHAEVKPNSLFSDNAVLQRDCNARVWGTARQGEKVTVEFAGQKVSAEAKEGRWKVELKPMQAGGPFTMTLAGDNTITLTNILVGDVWVAGGQSNMEEPLKGFSGGTMPIDHWQAEVAAANYPQIRQFFVPQAMAGKPVADANGKWTACSPGSAADFSAVGYFFARDLQQTIKVPVGILVSRWGGTAAEAWTSANSLKTMPDFADALAAVQKSADSPSHYEKSLDEWYRQNDPASVAQPAWSDPAFDASQWKIMNLPTAWENAGLPDYDGVVWFRKEITLPESWAGKSAVLHLGPVDDQDTTWVNGVRVGAMHVWNETRNYPIPAGVLKAGRNVIVARVLDTGAAGGIDGKPEQMKLEASDAGSNRAHFPGRRRGSIGKPWRCQIRKRCPPVRRTIAMRPPSFTTR